VEVVEGAADHLGARVLHSRGRGVGAGEARDVVAGLDELGDDGRADPTGRAGDENTHENPPGSEPARVRFESAVGDGPTAMSVTDITVALMSATVINIISCRDPLGAQCP